MAAKATTSEEMEELYIPRGTKQEEQNVLIGINGKNWLLPKGATSKVPVYVAEEYRRSQRAADYFAQRSEELQNQTGE
jgi:hypothetical protein